MIDTETETIIMVRYVKKKRSERIEETPSPSKNLSDQPVIPPIGKSNSFIRETSRQSFILEIPSRQSFLTPGLSPRSLNLDDIRLEKKSATEFGYERPVHKVDFNKQKTVHFDNFVRIR